MKTIKLIRHGESESNIGEKDPAVHGDKNINLTPLGKQEAYFAGQKIGKDFIKDALIYSSPYQRTRQTAIKLCEGAGIHLERVMNARDPNCNKKTIRIYEDPRLREVERGYGDFMSQQELRKLHGWFIFRHDGGESPADCYDRICTFLSSLKRQAKRKKKDDCLIVTHGLTIRCFLMRFFHLTVEEFNSTDNPKNCDIITIAHKDKLTEEPAFISGKWGVTGIKFRDK